MELISSVTVGSGGASSIDFTSIPATYTDLLLVFSCRMTDANQWLNIRFNGSATAVYSTRWLAGSGSSASSSSQASQSTIYNAIVGARSDYTANTFGSGQIYIPNYAGASNKTLSMESTGENNATASTMQLAAGIWANTSAITQVSLLPDYASIAQYSTAYLYGILKGSGGATVS